MNKPQPRSTHNTTGFTIVELLIVIVIIAILAAISIITYTNIQQRARDTQRAYDIANIKKALLAYDTVHGGVRSTVTSPRYNTTVDGAGGWDKSTDADWLAFLRTEHGNMPVDPVNEMAAGSNDPNASTEHRVYHYYCYPVGSGSLPATPSVRIGYHKENGTRVRENFPVTACL